MNSVTKAVHKIDGMALALGKPMFTEDLLPEGCLYLRLIRCPYAYAEVVRMDVEQARALPGVVAVYTPDDVPHNLYTNPGEPYPEGGPIDRYMIDRFARYVGDVVGLIAAEDSRTAEKALELVHVEYRVLKPILDPHESLKSETVIHQHEVLTHFDLKCKPEINQMGIMYDAAGDLEKAFGECDVIVEATCRTQAQAHAMLETHRSLSYLDYRGKIVVIAPMQSPFHVQRVIARATGIDPKRIRTVQSRVGGSFGAKNNLFTEIYCAFVTWKTGRPAYHKFSRTEAFCCTNTRHDLEMRYKLGATKEGVIKAIDVQALCNGGAYAEDSQDTMYVGCHNTLPIYTKIDAIRYNGVAVYTNIVPGGAFRGFGAPQNTFALGVAVSRLAEKLQMDITQLQLKNIAQVGDHHPFLKGDEPITSTSLARCIQRGKDIIGWDEKYPRRAISPTKVRGVGMSVGMHGSGIAKMDKVFAMLRLNYDASFTLYVGACDLGTGSDTILLQIAAEVLQIPVENINYLHADCDYTPYDKGAYASSTVHVTGNAVMDAAQKMRKMILDGARRLMKTDEEAEVLYDGKKVFTADGSKQMPMDEYCQKMVSYYGDMDQLTATGSYACYKSPPPYATCFAEVEVDLETGKYELLNCAVIADIGTVINPNTARVQLEGGTAQAIGFAMFEEVRYDKDGRLLTSDYINYKIPCQMDIPDLKIEFIESYEPSGPYGAKSLGELAVHTPPPAIADALFNAVGVRIYTTPITPEKVWAALQEKGREV